MQLYEIFCAEFKLSKQEVSQFAFSAPKKYKIYSIPKRTNGVRVIAHPSRKLKAYQRLLVKILTPILPVHNFAMAYRSGLGIKHNAVMHLGGRYLLKMDFQNFFTSITPELFFKFLDRLSISLTKDDRYLLRSILFCNLSKKSGGSLRLSIGAPSSPLISNSIMYFFDSAASEMCLKMGITYTRYADDLTFSTNVKNALFGLPRMIDNLLYENFGDAILVNRSKTVFSSKAHNRHVTGVTITNEGRMSVGREKKRLVSSLIHKYSLNQLDLEEIDYLRGYLSYVIDIEPDFLNRMEKKYSRDLLESLIRGGM